MYWPGGLQEGIIRAERHQAGEREDADGQGDLTAHSKEEDAGYGNKVADWAMRDPRRSLSLFDYLWFFMVLSVYE